MSTTIVFKGFSDYKKVSCAWAILGLVLDAERKVGPLFRRVENYPGFDLFFEWETCDRIVIRCEVTK